jgi:hypothetical protein
LASFIAGVGKRSLAIVHLLDGSYSRAYHGRVQSIVPWEFTLPHSVPAGAFPSVAAILSTIPASSWFSLPGASENRSQCEAELKQYLARLGGDAAGVEWLADWREASAVARGLDERTSLWNLEDISRRRASTSVRSRGREQVLVAALSHLSELGYEYVRASVEDEETARVASGAALWTASLAITCAASEDPVLGAANPFLPKLRIFELGHWPLGMRGGAFVIL